MKTGRALLFKKNDDSGGSLNYHVTVCEEISMYGPAESWSSKSLNHHINVNYF